jgi:hypothetical protein
MSKKFIVVVKPFSVKVNGETVNLNNITAYFQSLNWKIWHWIDNMWLLSDVADDQTPRAIWEALKSHIGVTHLNGVVIDPVTSTYWGNNAKEGWEWMRLNWGVADSSPAAPSVEESTTDSSKDVGVG